MAEFASKGVAGTGLGLGIAGTALGLLSGGVGRLFNTIGGGAQGTPSGMETAAIAAMAGLAMNNMRGNCGGCNCGGCGDDHTVNRYESAQQARIAELETEVKLRDANTYTDQKILATYQYVDGQLRQVRDELCAQKVLNQKTQDSFALAQADLAAVKSELKHDIELEAERRCCADNAIVNYANATFYPKMVADVTVGSTNTAQTLYNPIPKCGCGCGK